MIGKRWDKEPTNKDRRHWKKKTKNLAPA